MNIFIRFWSTDTFLAMVAFLFIKNPFRCILSLTWLRVNTAKLKEESNAEPWLLAELYSEKIHVNLKRVVLIDKVISVPQ